MSLSFFARLVAVAAAASATAGTLAAFPAAAHPDADANLNLPSPFLPASPSNPSNSSPCPLVNALVNHGVLQSHNLTAAAILAAVQAVGSDSTIATILASSAISRTSNTTTADGTPVILDLIQLGVHGGLEHDASLTRADAAIGDAYHLNRTLYAQLKSFASEPGHISQGDIIAFRAAREADSRARNPGFTFGLREQFLASVEASIVQMLLADPEDADRRVRLDWADVLFLEERLPFELGWSVRPLGIAEARARALQINPAVAPVFASLGL
ncbi:Chloroperoxidase [Zopfochytrium polystomum]|nr:Chloroperoxidase [Zopfochytrium polystomum]